jgi:hypothetical protein
MIERFGKAWKSMPRRVVETLEDGDPVCVNHLFEGAMEMKSQLEPGTVVSMGGMQTAPAWTTTISANRAPGSISASNGWAGCVAQALT